MITFPNAKLNLGLYITNRRTDGYHDLETIFYPLPALHDALELIKTGGQTQLHISGKAVAGDPANNIIIKAWQLLHKEFPGFVPEFEIYLLKSIPMGAGMGGGSADGAFMLRLLNEYCNLKMDNETLAKYALQLGSDCPFFIYNTPQFAKGRGELMEPVSIDLSGCSIQLICPKLHISTADAFKMISPRPAAFNLKTLNDLPIHEWKDRIANDFEVPVFEQHPVLADIKKQLYNQGALYASMSGSGSTIYGLFPKTQRVAINTKVEFETYWFE